MTAKNTQITPQKPLPKRRVEAMELGETYFFTGVPCRRGHIAKRYTTSGRCAQCSREDTNAAFAKFKAAFTAAKMKKKKQNPETLTAG